MSECKEISTKIKKIKELRDEFKDIYSEGGEENEKLIEIKKEAETLIHELIDDYCFGIDFTNKLKDVQFIQRIVLEIEGRKDLGDKNLADTLRLKSIILINFFKKIFPNQTKRKKITSQMYQRFLEALLDPQIKKNTEIDWAKRSAVGLEFLNSVFLDFSLAENGRVNMDQPLPKDFDSSFGFGWKEGTANLLEVGDWLGERMTGGQIYAKKAKFGAGFNMAGGVLRVEEAGEGLAPDMYGGTIIVKKAAMEAGRVSQSMKTSESNGSGGTILFEKIQSFADSVNPNIIFCSYNAKDNIYYTMTGTDTDQIREIKPMSSDNDLRNAHDRMAGVYMIDDVTKFTYPVTRGWGNGVLVLRDLPEKNIGEGMFGGAVIIESTLPVEEVRSRVMKENRLGGFILMRVPDPTAEDPSNTKLIDLEDDM